MHEEEFLVPAGWPSEGPHSCLYPGHSPAPQGAGTQPWPSSTKSWYAATAELHRELVSRELVCRKMHRSSKQQSRRTKSHRSIPSLPFQKKKKKEKKNNMAEASVPSPPPLAEVFRLDTGNQIWEIQQEQGKRKKGMCTLINSQQV